MTRRLDTSLDLDADRGAAFTEPREPAIEVLRRLDPDRCPGSGTGRSAFRTVPHHLAVPHKGQLTCTTPGCPRYGESIRELRPEEGSS